MSNRTFNPYTELEAEGVPLGFENALADDVAGAHESAEVQHFGRRIGLVADLVGDRPRRRRQFDLHGVRVKDDELAGVAEPVEVAEAERVHGAIQKTKLIAPPMDCIAPIGEDLIEKALRAEVQADFYSSFTRKPAVYRGNPFLVDMIEHTFTYHRVAPGNEAAVDAAVRNNINHVNASTFAGAAADTLLFTGANKTWKVDSQGERTFTYGMTFKERRIPLIGGGVAGWQHYPRPDAPGPEIFEEVKTRFANNPLYPQSSNFSQLFS